MKIELILRALLYVLAITLLVYVLILLNELKTTAIIMIGSMVLSETIVNSIIFYSIILALCVVIIIVNTYGLIKSIVKTKKKKNLI